MRHTLHEHNLKKFILQRNKNLFTIKSCYKYKSSKATDGKL